jgi:hypothetical protein
MGAALASLRADARWAAGVAGVATSVVLDSKEKAKQWSTRSEKKHRSIRFFFPRSVHPCSRE